ncbi:AtpZ/AtpI family protein [Winogradskyella vidalii]|uniref:AtpZ/AtpI family protein n=1 Tax=Winogradskyella vidalii TaxID=2615024 RepID=UPI0015C77EB2|nr:AtpZ/AtpI family protein [Winogradskyella vidalii]
MSQVNPKKPPLKPNLNKGPNKYIQFVSVGFQMGGTIILGNYLGQWLDAKYHKDFLETTITLFAVFMSIYLVISQVTKVSKEDD